VEQMSFPTGPEDSRGGCGGDVLRQTVPDTSSSDWKARSPTVDSRVRLTISDKDVLERSR